jgi:hypothetical protein
VYRGRSRGYRGSRGRCSRAGTLVNLEAHAKTTDILRMVTTNGIGIRTVNPYIIINRGQKNNYFFKFSIISRYSSVVNSPFAYRILRILIGLSSIIDVPPVFRSPTVLGGNGSFSALDLIILE